MICLNDKDIMHSNDIYVQPPKTVAFSQKSESWQISTTACKIYEFHKVVLYVIVARNMQTIPSSWCKNLFTCHATSFFWCLSRLVSALRGSIMYTCYWYCWFWGTGEPLHSYWSLVPPPCVSNMLYCAHWLLGRQQGFSRRLPVRNYIFVSWYYYYYYYYYYY